MSGVKLSPEVAAAVWDMLIEVCIGEWRQSQLWKEQFIQDATGDGISEWRFSGRLGFGGKIYSNPWRVDCYREDRTPEREAMIAEANRRLKEIIGERKGGV